MSRTEARVYFTIKKYGALSPTQIGSYLGFEYEKASQMVARPLNRLVQRQVLCCERINQRKVLYAVIDSVVPPIELYPDAVEFTGYVEYRTG